jgi:hypothetical protein
MRQIWTLETECLFGQRDHPSDNRENCPLLESINGKGNKSTYNIDILDTRKAKKQSNGQPNVHIYTLKEGRDSSKKGKGSNSCESCKAISYNCNRLTVTGIVTVDNKSIPVDVLIDSGALQDSYVSMDLVLQSGLNTQGKWSRR